MIINFAAHTIEMTKKEMKAAGHFGSDEYKALMEARKDNPGFLVSVSVRKVKRKNNSTYKGLSYEFMEAYIKAHDPDKSIMTQYRMLRGLCEDIADNLPQPYSYQETKAWFLTQYKEIADFYTSKHIA